MKIYYWIIAVILMGYSSGILLESVAFQDDSKIQSLVKTGTFTNQWIPFGMAKAFVESNISTSDITLGSDSLSFLQDGFLLVGDPILTNGYVDFTFAVENTGDQLANKITECIFQPKDTITEAFCLVCELLDNDKVIRADGNIDLTGLGLVSLQEETIVVSPTDPINDPWGNSVKNIHAVRIKVCLPGEGGEGCTPGFWKTHSAEGPAFDAWPDSGTDFNGSPINLDELTTKFSAVFDRIIMAQDGFTGMDDPLLLDALGAQGGGVNALARHAAAAYFNSITSVMFDLTTATVIADFQTAFDSGDYEPQKDIFQDFNELGCPLGNSDDDDEDDVFSETGGVDEDDYDELTDTSYNKKQYIIHTLSDLIANNPSLLQTTINELTFANTSLAASINPLYWVNDDHVDIVNGQIVLDKSKEAVLALIDVTNDPNEVQSIKDTVQTLIDEIIAADTILAEVALDDIDDCGGKNSKIDNHLSNAQSKMEDALEDSNNKKYDRAIQKFYDAWLDAYEATTSCPSGYWTQLDGYTVVP